MEIDRGITPPMSEHEVRAEMMGRTIDNVLHEVDEASGIDRITLELRLLHHRSYKRPEIVTVTIQGKRQRGLSLHGRQDT